MEDTRGGKALTCEAILKSRLDSEARNVSLTRVETENQRVTPAGGGIPQGEGPHLGDHSRGEPAGTLLEAELGLVQVKPQIVEKARSQIERC